MGVVMEIKRGDIFLVNLDPIKGSEQGGVRPVLILQNNIANQYSPITIVAAITSKIFDKEFPTNVFLPKKDSGLDRDSTAMLNQIRTIDKSRVMKNIGRLNEALIKKVNLAVKVSLDIE